MTKYFTERMRKMDNKFLLSLLNSVSVSGYEEILQQKVEAEMRPWADEIRKDEMNNLICIVNRRVRPGSCFLPMQMKSD